MKDKPAFPFVEPGSPGYAVSTGMDIRTWLAGQSITAASKIKMPMTEEYIQAVIINPDKAAAIKYRAEFIAATSVQMADAIIAELEKTK